MTPSGTVAGIGTDQFLQLLVAQLQNQDPLDPVSDRDFIAQLTALNTLQGVQDLNATFSEVLRLQELTNGTNLIGKTVQFTPTGGGPLATGTVDSVGVRDGRFVLQVGGQAVGLDQISTVGA
ncbi:MAG: flagellar hook capping protein [Isosphaera sp.]|nr:flagellar hook capping protein [Isosphaera sp.]